jgi:DtxR family transcriptional regulator, Mn-dependent transcriptional regulator
MSWAEVHDEAEQLEHAVSDRLIDRIDEMLGRPAVDPHGDPIPDHEGVIQAAETDSLLNCPLNEALVVSRVLDQDSEFLHFVEQSSLKPGQAIVVESRNDAADRVMVRVEGRLIALGTRAASKLMVERPANVAAGGEARPASRPGTSR